MKPLLGLLILVALGLTVAAQPFEQKVMGTDGKPVSSATVIFKPLKGAQAQIFAITDVEGKFRVQLKPLSLYQVVVRHLSFETDTFFVETLADGISAPDRILLKPRHQQLQEVTIVRKAPVVIRQDTVTYRADAYAGPDTRKVEDLLAKMQGFSIGSDGQITYNGHVVERVMIEGDDLTGRSYQLLTRNLNAGYIDKVEVLLNDHENRVLKEQGNAGKVGINLSIRKNLLGKWNGGIDLLASINKRYEADGHGILVKKKLKVFSFFNLNNIANNPLDEAEAYEEMENASASHSGVSGRDMVLQSGELFPPDLPEKYVRNNNDAGLATMLTWKTGKHTSMRLMAGAQKRSWVANLSSNIKTFPDSLQTWQVSNDIFQEQVPQTTFLRLTANTDRGKKAVIQCGMQMAYIRQSNRYMNLTSIDISDSLVEQLTNEGLQARAGWKATMRTNKNVVSVTHAELWYQGIDQRLSNYSSRYAGYFNLKQGNYLQLQDLSGRGWGLSLGQNWIKKYSSWTMKMGGSIAYSYEELGGRARLMNVQADTAYNDGQVVQIKSADLFTSLRLDKWKKMSVSTELRGGPRVLDWKGTRNLTAGGNLMAEWVYKFSLLQTFRLSWQYSRDLPERGGFIPDPLISGNGVILRSIPFSKPEQRQLLQLGYFANILKHQLTWSLRLQWRLGQTLYIPDMFVTPAYSVNGWQLASGNWSSMLMGTIEKYVHPIRGKLGFSLIGNALNGMIMLNQESALTRNRSVFAEVWWAGLISKKIKVETRFKVAGNLTQMDQQPAQTLWFPGWSQKASWQWSEQGFLSCLWRASPFGSGRYAHGIDAYLHQKIGKRWTLRLQAHNLLNQQRLMTRQISAYQSGSSSYDLVGRYVLLGGSLQL
ncbi:MAG: hypothetical protein ACK57D_04400 [Sphingobacteriales bacterium]